MKLPQPHHSIPSLLDKHLESMQEPPRAHLGVSQVGHPCDRWVWLSFRWAVQPRYSGQMLRIFRRGKAEEATILSDLRSIGVEILDKPEQAQVDFGCHVRGSLDAIILSGIPEAPQKLHVAEFKTHNLRSFNELEKKGVAESKPQHYAQMQLYMLGTRIDRALYLAVCKDDDRIYTQRIEFDREYAENKLARAKRLAMSSRMPEPISADPSWYQCKMCDAHEFCHETKTTKHVNCRTCAHVTPMKDSTWRCERHDADGIPVEFQRQGCESHVLHPDLVPWQRKDGLDQWTAVYVIEGRDVANGEGDSHVYTSKEILANPKMCSLGDEYVEKLRETFDARIVG